MMSAAASKYAWVTMAKPELAKVIDRLQVLGYRTIGPQLRDGAIVYGDLRTMDQLPFGIVDEQDGGRYRVHSDSAAGWFDYVVGPHSLKNFLFKPQETIQELIKQNGSWSVLPAPADEPALAVIGVRGCDMRALEVQDRVFLRGEYVDPNYRRRRESLFLLAVNCRRATATCFCHSMKCGPDAGSGYDLALTEMEEQFVVEVGTERGGEALADAAWSPCSQEDVDAARAVPQKLAKAMAARTAEPLQEGQPRPRSLDTTGIRDLLYDNLQHARWDEVAQRCLACANCTMVCPTCFCSTVEEVADLTGEHVLRERVWASCFSSEHSAMSSGAVRKSIASQYRQWLTHKLAGWHDQFGVSGCVGCGRCITWCPVAIDLTEEVAAIRGTENQGAAAC